jgi:hypothetical protein
MHMRWLFSILTVLCLWVAFNALFMLSGRYDAFNFLAAGISIAIAIVCAWFGGRRFISGMATKRRAAGSVWTSPPMVICVTGLVVIALAALLRVIGHRWP